MSARATVVFMLLARCSGGPSGVDTSSSGTDSTDSGETDTGEEPDCNEWSDGEMTVLASEVMTPVAITVDQTDVWWVGGYDEGYLMRCAKDRCADTLTVVAAEQPAPRDLVVDAGKAYWSLLAITGSCSSDGMVMQCDVDDCETTAAPFVLSLCSNDLAIDATHLYLAEWSGGVGSVERCARTGCDGNSDEVVEVTGGPAAMMVSGDKIVWIAQATGIDTGGSVTACDKADCTPQILASGPSILPVQLAVDGEYVYWTNADGSIMKCGLMGCGNAPTVLASGLDSPYAIATDGADVFWTTTPMGGGGGIHMIAVDGTELEPTTLATGPMVITPASIALDQDGVYWTDISADLVAKIGKCP